jgi:hypothetical protein
MEVRDLQRAPGVIRQAISHRDRLLQPVEYAATVMYRCAGSSAKWKLLVGVRP